MDELVKLFDVGHFEHNRFDGFEHVGKTVYNMDNHRQPVRKYGKAPCELLVYYPHWFTKEQAERCLSLLGFVKKNQVEWTR